jgi:hypothetical protein
MRFWDAFAGAMVGQAAYDLTHREKRETVAKERRANNYERGVVDVIFEIVERRLERREEPDEREKRKRRPAALNALNDMPFVVFYSLWVGSSFFAFPYLIINLVGVGIKWLIGFTFGPLDWLLYWIAWPFTWVGGKLLPWIRDADLAPTGAVDFSRLPYAAAGLGLTIGAVVVIFFAINLSVQLAIRLLRRSRTA